MSQDNSIIRSIGLSIISIVILSIGFIPLLLYVKLLIIFVDIENILYWFLLPFLISIGFMILLISQILFSGLIIHIFHIVYEPGVYPYNIREKNVFRWMLLCTLYTPARKLMEIFPIGGLKNFYYKLLGMHIGENTLVGGVVKDPCVTSFGSNTTMGEYAIIYGHIHDYSRGTITIRRVHIGDNCIIGAGAIIMPGVTIQDNVIVAAGAVVPQNKILESGKTYAGIPAKPIT